MNQNYFKTDIFGFSFSFIRIIFLLLSTLICSDAIAGDFKLLEGQALTEFLNSTTDLETKYGSIGEQTANFLRQGISKGTVVPIKLSAEFLSKLSYDLEAFNPADTLNNIRDDLLLWGNGINFILTFGNNTGINSIGQLASFTFTNSLANYLRTTENSPYYFKLYNLRCVSHKYLSSCIELLRNDNLTQSEVDSLKQYYAILILEKYLSLSYQAYAAYINNALPLFKSESNFIKKLIDPKLVPGVYNLGHFYDVMVNAASNYPNNISFERLISTIVSNAELITVTEVLYSLAKNEYKEAENEKYSPFSYQSPVKGVVLTDSYSLFKQSKTELSSKKTIWEFSNLALRYSIPLSQMNSKIITQSIALIAHAGYRWNPVTNVKDNADALLKAATIGGVGNGLVIPALALLQQFDIGNFSNEAKILAPMINQLNPMIGSFLKEKMGLPIKFSEIHPSGLNFENIDASFRDISEAHDNLGSIKTNAIANDIPDFMLQSVNDIMPGLKKGDKPYNVLQIVFGSGSLHSRSIKYGYDLMKTIAPEETNCEKLFKESVMDENGSLVESPYKKVQQMVSSGNVPSISEDSNDEGYWGRVKCRTEAAITILSGIALGQTFANFPGAIIGGAYGVWHADDAYNNCIEKLNKEIIKNDTTGVPLIPKPGAGETDKPGAGETDKPGAGETDKPGAGETQEGASSAISSNPYKDGGDMQPSYVPNGYGHPAIPPEFTEPQSTPGDGNPQFYPDYPDIPPPPFWENDEIGSADNPRKPYPGCVACGISEDPIALCKQNPFCDPPKISLYLFGSKYTTGAIKDLNYIKVNEAQLLEIIQNRNIH